MPPVGLGDVLPTQSRCDFFIHYTSPVYRRTRRINISNGPATAGAGEADIVLQPTGGQALVLPPQISLGIGAAQLRSVTWRNGTPDKFWLWFPHGDDIFDGSHDDFLKPTKIKAGEASPSRSNPG